MKLKNLTAISFALLLMAPLGIMKSVIWYKKMLVRKEIKHQLMETLPKENLILISIRKSQKNTELEWEHSREFEFKGAMYDVVYEESEGDNIHYWCWPDTKESSLNQILKSMAEKEHDKSDSELISFFQLLTYVCNKFELPPVNNFNNTVYNGYIESIFFSWITKPETPPPSINS